MIIEDIVTKGLPTTDEEYRERLELAFLLGFNEHIEITLRDQGLLPPKDEANRQRVTG